MARTRVPRNPPSPAAHGWPRSRPVRNLSPQTRPSSYLPFLSIRLNVHISMSSVRPSAYALLLPLVLIAASGCAADAGSIDDYNPELDSLRFDGEHHIRNIRQLTFGGNNAEAYFSFDNTQLIFQSDWDAINPRSCDQQFVMNADGSLRESGERRSEEHTSELQSRGHLVCRLLLDRQNQINGQC